MVTFGQKPVLVSSVFRKIFFLTLNNKGFIDKNESYHWSQIFTVDRALFSSWLYTGSADSTFGAHIELDTTGIMLKHETLFK